MAARRAGRTALTRKPTSRRLRWAVALALVLAAHLLAVLGLLHMPGLPRDPTAPPPLEAILLPPPAPPAPVAPPRPAPAAPKRPPAARVEPTITPTPEPPVAAPAAPEAPALLATPGAGPSMASAAGGAGSSAAPASAPAAAPPDNVRYAAPPSTLLHYASFVNGVQNPDGLIRWQHDGAHYQLAVETRVLWFRFAFHSTGALDERGLAPERYEESRRNRVEAARFDRAAGMLVFEGRGKQEPLPAAGQDRFSVFLQMVGLVRGNPQRYATPGVTETFDVADTRDLEPMQVQYVGEEDVDTGHGLVRAKHFVRLPRHANDRRRVEVWLAQSLQWMPVKLRQTEPDGTQIELVYRDSEPLR
ncbi:DUF3108 domain-containing protein [Cupriavidus basilensis]|uniref:DUF3108 domain-containing protein n=1 Tax=Cupriavidus basilensis TaxID=68895 RepID=UPI000B12E6AF|nr:DUF3108 domain-containing protein [Cupriavidus basilensis]